MIHLQAHIPVDLKQVGHPAGVLILVQLVCKRAKQGEWCINVRKGGWGDGRLGRRTEDCLGMAGWEAASALPADLACAAAAAAHSCAPGSLINAGILPVSAGQFNTVLTSPAANRPPPNSHRQASPFQDRFSSAFQCQWAMWAQCWSQGRYHREPLGTCSMWRSSHCTQRSGRGGVGWGGWLLGKGQRLTERQLHVHARGPSPPQPPQPQPLHHHRRH